MEQWIHFYKEYFESEKERNRFILKCESLRPQSDSHKAKIMMHQGKRLVSIANEMESVAGGRDSLKLMFLIIACENVYKLSLGKSLRGDSNKSVKKFFNVFVSPEDKEILTKGIHLITPEESDYDLADIIEALYKIRCDIVHEGYYWGFDFACKRYPTVLSGRGTDLQLRVSLQYEDLRGIIVRGIIRAVERHIN
ncbi:hypothetical protein ACOMICROBIO_GDFFDHBD_03366 [Vibrio sp. B1REV9]|uniref:HEPN domain-containing protein n=1 Tax=Vibrio sp. B1REV9 TaxID=2751179 RepID=UPI001B013AD4|nr:HEPN domain-containing protein [Vibrio sp. B1REV9]CAE6946481.1 hypothetical protein ACOMICROBIO_GDFFDHBD_03366 [Vibrio sp. B1REV9]